MSRMLHDGAVCLQWVTVDAGNSTRHGCNMENLYGTRDGIAHWASELMKILGEIESARRNGHLSPKTSSPTDVKYEAAVALSECARRSIAPPDELVTLIAQLLGTPDESRRRSKIRFPLAKVRRIKAETGLSGRALGRHLRERGLKVSDRSVARYEKDKLVAPQKT
jgi:hypothetical protein